MKLYCEGEDYSHNVFDMLSYPGGIMVALNWDWVSVDKDEIIQAGGYEDALKKINPLEHSYKPVFIKQMILCHQGPGRFIAR